MTGGTSYPVMHKRFRIKDDRKIDPACGSGGMFIQSGDFVNQSGMNANSAMTFYGQEKVEYNAQHWKTDFLHPLLYR